MSIFKASDIRGIYPKELDEKFAYKIGFVFASYVKGNSLVVGRDNRVSSPDLAVALLEGMRDAGKDVVYIGPIDSPGFYFASWKFKMPGMMITASHNPATYNGFYLVESGARPIYQKNGLKKIEQRYNKIKVKRKSKVGALSMIDIKPYYKEAILGLVKHRIKPMKIVLDAGNGIGGVMAEKIFSEFPQINLVPLFFELDGRYPNRGPDPTVESNLLTLQKKVVKEKADFGLAYDGDADRVALVDEKGSIVQGSITGALIAEYLLSHSRKKEKIVCSIGCTKALREVVEKYKSTYIRERVGHSFISDHMHHTGALFGVEQTGHFFYRDTHYAESPLLTSLLLCSIYSASKKKMSQLLEPYKKYYMTSEINFPFKNSKKIILKLQKKLKEMYKTKMDTFDGLYIETPDLWFRIRPSQTEPALRLTLEGKSKSHVDVERKKLESIIKSVMKE